MCVLLPGGGREVTAGFMRDLSSIVRSYLWREVEQSTGKEIKNLDWRASPWGDSIASRVINISPGLWHSSKKPSVSELEQIVSLRLILVCYWRKPSRPAYFPKWLTLLPFLLSTWDKEVYSVSLFIDIPLPKISPNKAYLMFYSLLKGKLIYNKHLIINFLKGGFGTGIHNNREVWLFQRGHFCYPFCTVEEMKPTEPRWGWMWHNQFEVLFVFPGWPTSHQKESPSPNWSSSKIWGEKRI